MRIFDVSFPLKLIAKTFMVKYTHGQSLLYNVSLNLGQISKLWWLFLLYYFFCYFLSNSKGLYS